MASVQAFSQSPFLLAEKASGDLSSDQYKCVKYSSGQMALCSSQGEQVHGLLQNDGADAAGKACTVAVGGVAEGLLGGTVSQADFLCSSSSGTLIKSNDPDEFVVGLALSDGSSGERIPVLLLLGAYNSADQSQQTFTSSADYSSSGQYTAMKAHTVAGQIVQQTTGGASLLGILQNAPASAAEAEIAVFGECTAKAGTSGVSAGDELAVEASTGKLITAVAGDLVVGWSLADIAADANGSVFLGRPYLKSVDGVALADGKIWVGNGSGAAAAVTMSGDATLANDGALTIGEVLDGGNAGDVGDAPALGGIPLIIPIACTGGATANFDATLTNKMRIADFWVVLKGAGSASDTVQLFNGANAISDALDISAGGDKDVFRAGELDDAYHEVAASGTLRVTVTDGGGSDVPACQAYVLAYRVA